MELHGKWKKLIYVIIVVLIIAIVLGGAHMIRSFDAPPEDFVVTGLAAVQVERMEVEFNGEKKSVMAPEEMERIVNALRSLLYPAVKPIDRAKVNGTDMTIRLYRDGSEWKTVELVVEEGSDIWVKGGKKMRKAQWEEDSLALWNELSAPAEPIG